MNAYDSPTSRYPELVFGLVGPVGTNVKDVELAIRETLKSLSYTAVTVKLTKLMKPYAMLAGPTPRKGTYGYYTHQIAQANEIRRHHSNSALATLAVTGIITERLSILNEDIQQKEMDPSTLRSWLVDIGSSSKTAYIINQLKRPEEVDLLRSIYGEKFIQISIHSPEKDRVEFLTKAFLKSDPGKTIDDHKRSAEDLVKQDQNEKTVASGQRVAKIFQRGDVFIDGHNRDSINRTTTRFLHCLFGDNRISPKRDEHGMYIASSASLRSLDPSRQIGAAIFTKNGEVISLGCNEVPKAKGGTYWGEDGNPQRDVETQAYSNRTRKQRIAFDFLERLKNDGYLKLEDTSLDNAFNDMMASPSIKGALLHDITEYGRMLHAEMNAITDAARLGRSCQDSVMYSTAFPCHNCAKHIVGSGISRLSYIEPYPKSRAIELNGDSITVDSDDPRKVKFNHFIGIAPRRYSSLFQKSARHNRDGEIQDWYDGNPQPRLDDRGDGHVVSETMVFGASIIQDTQTL